MGSGFWECKCSCGSIGKVNTHNLRNNMSTMCPKCAGKKRFKHSFEPGQQINQWTVQYYAGNMRWHCKCSCGVEKDVLTRDLANKSSKSCGHDRNYHIIRKDITGEKFGELTVLKYSGKDNMWTCKCSCGNIKDIHRDSLMTGKTRSCGCLKEKMRAETLLEKYGETNTIRVTRPREEWQILALDNKKVFVELLDTIGHKITIMELSRILDVREGIIKDRIASYGLQDRVVVGEYRGESNLEIEICTFLEEAGFKIEKHNRDILYGQELDIYIPNERVAIEVNGDYWHSDLFKNKEYHQNKALKCLNRGIQLIHIYEHEWMNRNTNNKIKNLILSNMQGREFDLNNVVRLDIEYGQKYIRDNFIGINNNIHIFIGYKEKDKIKGVITLYKYKDNIYITNIMCEGQVNKVEIIKHVIKKLSIDKNIQVKSICSLDNGPINILLKAGFIPDIKTLTEPSQRWVDFRNYYRIDNTVDTEDNLRNNGYIREYNSGFITLIQK